MPLYTEDELDDLEASAEDAPPLTQSDALAVVASILEQNSISYGVMGGMNFWLRGSSRTTGDVDIAVDNPPRMDMLLTIFNNHEGIYRPSNKMQWASGVARIFVKIQDQIVQLDLKPKGAEGHLIPRDIVSSVERLSFETSSGAQNCCVLTIGPLVAAKIKSHYSRMTDDDYIDLIFVCLKPDFAPQVRQYAANFREEWKECFLEQVLEKDPDYEERIRWALGMERTPLAP